LTRCDVKINSPSKRGGKGMGSKGRKNVKKPKQEEKKKK
jgi:hypothetical protein